MLAMGGDDTNQRVLSFQKHSDITRCVCLTRPPESDGVACPQSVRDCCWIVEGVGPPAIKGVCWWCVTALSSAGCTGNHKAVVSMRTTCLEINRCN
jgi:hypothetical protein